MKLVIQRVTKASVSIGENSNIVGNIENGLLVLVGIKKGDTKKEAELLANKLLKIRLIADEDGKMNYSVVDKKQDILVVSQFTLHANTSDGNRPSFIEASTSEEAMPIYEEFLTQLKKSNLNIQTGKFGEYMKISAELDGPVTIITEQ